MTNYLKSFVIGSSLPVFLSFFLTVAKINKNIKNYSYQSYTIIAPLYFGLMNVLSLFLSNYFNFDDRYLVTGIASSLIVMTFAKLTNSYNFDTNEWYYYSFRIFIKHFLIWNIVIRFLEKNV